jgi:hypothetical protein
MFEHVFENLRKATESTVQVQQEMFRKWASLWPGVSPAPSPWSNDVKEFQKKWSETVAELLKKQRESLETQFSAGLKNIEEAFHLTKAEDPEEFRAKTLELWRKSFDHLRQASEAQLRDFQAAVEKWTELMAKKNAAA